MADDFDDLSRFEAKNTSHTLPLGWQILFWGLILFGIYYAIAYTPSLGGWSQERAFTESVK
ncbi:MAG TPA: cbb3-type cytochrome c oxidase N-terminal domain-containing protein [Nitrospirota bacterium]|nr:cbb3-type cytochrome c oxidase N-terminal domain-containing protein [Nitrospirota bacterium]